MIPGGLGAQPGAGAIMVGQAARGFGGAMWHALRAGAVAAPQPVTIQMPTGGMNAASAAAMTAIAAQVSAETAAFIAKVSPYVKGGFYGFAILLCLVIIEKVYNGPVGALLMSAAKGLMVVLRAGAPVARTGTVKFIKAVGRLLKALYALPAHVRDAILERTAQIQTWAHRKITTVREGLSVVHGYVKSSRNAVVGTMRRSLARVKAAGVRVRTTVGGFRQRLKAKAKAKENAATMARNQKIRANLTGINQRVTANEERRIQSLINKVKRTSAPLTAMEKREYLKLTRKAEKQAQRNVNVAMTSVNRNAAQALVGMRGRGRSH
jgi:hypothetical protein